MRKRTVSSLPVGERDAELSLGLHGAEYVGVEPVGCRAAVVLQYIGVEADVERRAAEAGIFVAGQKDLDDAARRAVGVGERKGRRLPGGARRKREQKQQGQKKGK